MIMGGIGALLVNFQDPTMPAMLQVVFPFLFFSIGLTAFYFTEITITILDFPEGRVQVIRTYLRVGRVETYHLKEFKGISITPMGFVCRLALVKHDGEKIYLSSGFDTLRVGKGRAAIEKFAGKCDLPILTN